MPCWGRGAIFSHPRACQQGTVHVHVLWFLALPSFTFIPLYFYIHALYIHVHVHAHVSLPPPPHTHTHTHEHTYMCLPHTTTQIFHNRSFVSPQQRSELGIATIPATSLQVYALRAKGSIDNYTGTCTCMLFECMNMCLYSLAVQCTCTCTCE